MPRSPSLRSVLGRSSRVTKPARAAPSPSPSPSSRKPPRAAAPRRAAAAAAADDDAFFPDRLTDTGAVRLLEEELTLRDAVQAMRYIRAHMFTPLPPTGFRSGRVAELLNYRAAVAPVVTPGHMHAVLVASPTRTEREVAELVGRGVLRRVRVERRGAMGEALLEAADLEAMVRRAVSGASSGGLGAETADAFLCLLRERPTVQTLAVGAGEGAEGGGTGARGAPGLTSGQADELVRAGFLTSATHAAPGDTLRARPEDRATLTSIQHVSRFASGTVSAVGGRGAVHLAGGSGGTCSGVPEASKAPSGPDMRPGSFRIAVPGHGQYLKLAQGVAAWLREALGRTRWGEAPESWLRERFEGGGLYGTRWKDFWGVEWEWAIGQTVGLGVVELFDTGSVGRGVRALGG